jgi:hypothetical protein
MFWKSLLDYDWVGFAYDPSLFSLFTSSNSRYVLGFLAFPFHVPLFVPGKAGADEEG